MGAKHLDIKTETQLNVFQYLEYHLQCPPFLRRAPMAIGSGFLLWRRYIDPNDNDQ